MRCLDARGLQALGRAAEGVSSRPACSRRLFTCGRGGRGCISAPDPTFAVWHSSINSSLCFMLWFALMSWTETQNLTACSSHGISKREHEASYLKAGSHTSTRISPSGLLLLRASSMAKRDAIAQARTSREKREAGMSWDLRH